MRLNAYLARTGVASRRGADELIKTGRVRVNGVRGELNTFVEAGRRRRSRRAPARAAGARLRPAPQAGRSRHHRARPARAADRGRARPARGARPPGRPARRGHDRRARCSRTTATSRTGSRIPGTRWTRSTRPRSRASPRTRRSPRSRPGSSSTTAAPRRPAPAGSRPPAIELTIHEGRKHQVKRMLEAVGHPVRRLHRSRYAGLTVDDLEPGSVARAHRRRGRRSERAHS